LALSALTILSVFFLRRFASIPQPFFLFGVALLEVARRALWAVLRLEHEHLANVEHYRVTAAVPLLFATGDGGNVRCRWGADEIG
jgi:hypothetical protein